MLLSRTWSILGGRCSKSTNYIFVALISSLILSLYCPFNISLFKMTSFDLLKLFKLKQNIIPAMLTYTTYVTFLRHQIQQNGSKMSISSKRQIITRINSFIDIPPTPKLQWCFQECALKTLWMGPHHRKTETGNKILLLTLFLLVLMHIPWTKYIFKGMTFGTLH